MKRTTPIAIVLSVVLLVPQLAAAEARACCGVLSTTRTCERRSN
jgi:hypothetical protein